MALCFVIAAALGVWVVRPLLVEPGVVRDSGIRVIPFSDVSIKGLDLRLEQSKRLTDLSLLVMASVTAIMFGSRELTPIQRKEGGFLFLAFLGLLCTAMAILLNFVLTERIAAWLSALGEVQDEVGFIPSVASPNFYRLFTAQVGFFLAGGASVAVLTWTFYRSRKSA